MNKNKFPPNIDPQIYSLTAIIIGYSLSNNYNANELNSIGNWLILVGQYTLTYAAQKQLIESRENNSSYDIDFLKNAIKKIEKELNNIK